MEYKFVINGKYSICVHQYLKGDFKGNIQRGVELTFILYDQNSKHMSDY